MQMMVFFDFEVTKYDWLVVIIDPINAEETVIVNDPDKLEQFYQNHKADIWIGYNNRTYDNYILKSILLGFDPKEVNDYIIVQKNKGWQYSSLFNQIQLYSFDCLTDKRFSLKQLESFLGNSIKETSTPFDIDRKLTEEEIAEMIKYCRHDVEQTMIIFNKRKNEFDAQLALLKAFDLPINYIGKTQAQLAAIILGAKHKDYYDEWNIRIPETLVINKYGFVADWFLDSNNHNDDSYLECEIAGVPHIVKWGGLHGAINKYQYTCTDDELLIMADVDQLYPTLMIRYKLLSRSVSDYSKFEKILSESLRLKKEGKKKEREPYKRICNITYGAEGDVFNAMYDPLHRKLVCVYGQLLMVDLIEKIEGFADLIQSNTDGILIRIKRKDFELLDDTIYEWEKRTGLHMSFDYYKKIIQKDVNNYIAIPYGDLYDDKGKPLFKSTGGYVKALNDLDYDLPIVNKAMVDYIAYGTPVETTINNTTSLKDFQKTVKVSNKYLCGYHNHNKLTDKTFRVFASTDLEDTAIYKVKDKGEKGEVAEKFANTPIHCFIENGDINDVCVPDKLDRDWYIQLAKERLIQFGVM